MYEEQVVYNIITVIGVIVYFVFKVCYTTAAIYDIILKLYVLPPMYHILLYNTQLL